MKGFISYFIIGAVLILLSSTNCFSRVADKLRTNGELTQYLNDADMIMQGIGVIPQHIGDSDMIVQGEGSESTEGFLPKWKISMKIDLDENTTEEYPKIFDINKKTNNEEYKELNTNKETEKTITKEEQGYMNEVLLTFWHGVIAVLVGEAGALLVALAWTKIYKNNGKTNEN